MFWKENQKIFSDFLKGKICVYFDFIAVAGCSSMSWNPQHPCCDDITRTRFSRAIVTLGPILTTKANQLLSRAPKLNQVGKTAFWHFHKSTNCSPVLTNIPPQFKSAESSIPMTSGCYTQPTLSHFWKRLLFSILHVSIIQLFQMFDCVKVFGLILTFRCKHRWASVSVLNAASLNLDLQHFKMMPFISGKHDSLCFL